jgi:hypothetical protein
MSAPTFSVCVIVHPPDRPRKCRPLWWRKVRAASPEPIGQTIVWALLGRRAYCGDFRRIPLPLAKPLPGFPASPPGKTFLSPKQSCPETRSGCIPLPRSSIRSIRRTSMAQECKPGEIVPQSGIHTITHDSQHADMQRFRGHAPSSGGSIANLTSAIRRIPTLGPFREGVRPSRWHRRRR